MGDAKAVTELRKAGKLGEALELGRRLVQEDPKNIWNARALGWVIWAHVRNEVALVVEAEQANKAIPRKPMDAVRQWLKEYSGLPKEIPGMLHSQMVAQLAKVGRNHPSFVPFMVWAGEGWYQVEDLQPRTWEDRTFSPLVVKVARECAAWLNAHPQDLEKHAPFVEGQLKKAASCAREDDKVWVKWSQALLQRRLGNVQQAAQALSSVMKQKKAESWVWSEAARIHQEEQPELGIACYCQAMSCGGEPKFTWRNHLDLALLLAQQGETGWASKELVEAATIREKEGWPVGRELEEAMAFDWFDPSAEGVDPVVLRKEHAIEALSLCFDQVVTAEATFIGLEEHPYGKKPRPTFAAKWEGGPIFIRGRRANRMLQKAKTGLPVLLTVGIDDGRREIIDVLPRKDGEAWDALDSCTGVISRLDPEKHSVRVFLAFEDSCWVTIGDDQGGFQRMALGLGLSLKTMPNKTGKRRVMHWEPSGIPETSDIRTLLGRVDIKKSGVGFVEDVFIPQHLLAPELGGRSVRVIATLELDKKKNKPGWKAINLVPLEVIEQAPAQPDALEG